MRYAALVTLLLVLVPGAVSGQTAAPPADPIATALANLDLTLKEIARLLSQQSEGHNLDLLMKRVQLAAGQVAETEKRLASAEAARRSVEQERDHTEARLRMIEDGVQADGSEIPAAQAEMLTAQAEADLRRLRVRIAQLSLEIGALETREADQRRDLQSWQSTLDRRLAAQ